MSSLVCATDWPQRTGTYGVERERHRPRRAVGGGLFSGIDKRAAVAGIKVYILDVAPATLVLHL